MTLFFFSQFKPPLVSYGNFFYFFFLCRVFLFFCFFVTFNIFIIHKITHKNKIHQTQAPRVFSTRSGGVCVLPKKIAPRCLRCRIGLSKKAPCPYSLPVLVIPGLVSYLETPQNFYSGVRKLFLRVFYSNLGMFLLIFIWFLVNFGQK